MADTVAETTQTALDQLTQRLVELADTIAENAGPAGEAAWHVTMVALRLEAIASLGIGLALAVTSIVAIRYIVRWGKALAARADEMEDAAEGVLIVMGLVISATGTAFLAGGSIFYLLSVQIWVTAISPEAGLALRIINGL